MGIEFQLYKMKRILELDNTEESTTLWMHSIPLDCMLKTGEDGKFYYMYSAILKVLCAVVTKKE